MALDQPDIPEDAIRILAPYFGEALNEAPVVRTLDQVRDFLIQRIAVLLDRNPQHLMSILYRIDVAEGAVQNAFATAPPGRLAETLADLIIHRQLQKLETRRRYSGR